MTSHTEHTIAEFVERMGLIAQADGLPRIAGRIMGLMIVHGGPFSFAELSERLKVSRASVSTNTRLLETLGVIERTTAPGERQDYFRIRPRPYARLLQGAVERMRRACAVVGETRAALPADLQGTQERLDELEAFYQAMIDGFDTVIGKWEAKAKESAARGPGERSKQPA